MITIAEMRTEIAMEHQYGRQRLAHFELGRFEGDVTLTWVGPRRYRYIPSPDRFFSFTRGNGQRIVPGDMVTDAGTIPRIAWVIPDLDPWHFLPAYLIHDWTFAAHRSGRDIVDFAEANIILGEAIWTLIETGAAEGGALTVEAIYRAVGSKWGRELWDWKEGA